MLRVQNSSHFRVGHQSVGKQFEHNFKGGAHIDGFQNIHNWKVWNN